MSLHDDKLESWNAIAEMLFRFAASFDDRDWDAMRGCLAESVHCDYSSLRGERAGLVSRDEYIAQRRAALGSLVMQHDLTNLRITIEGTTATVLCNFVIRRFNSAPDADDFFHSYGRYRFGLVFGDSGWRIAAIVQTITRNRGNPRLHAGARSSAY